MLEVKTPEEVLALIRKEFSPLPDRAETVPLAKALGRVLAEDIRAEEYVPDFDRSTVDGYACRAADTFGCSDAVPAILKLVGEVRMGIYSAAKLHGLDFLPICVEEYDLLIPEKVWNTGLVKQLVRTLKSREFRERIEAMGGYTLDSPGEIIDVF